MIQATESTQAAYLASQYVTNMYYTPVNQEGEPNIGPLVELLGNAQIIWVRNDVETEYTAIEMAEKLIYGFYKNMTQIRVISSAFFSNGLSPYATAQTIQYWNGANKSPPGPYEINSIIQFTIKKDELTSQLFIEKVRHTYTSQKAEIAQ